ncbi:MAG: tRNA adenosine(34) deaminase TadA, partial [candidate division Zixibacteria bacterium]|nr:tRNA adenosine(34) deaminase TadA [candidate division Zixibacteria bacterium]
MPKEINPAEDIRWMKEALKEAVRALKINEVPVGAVIVFENQIVGRGHNQIESLNDATAHAEILAITAASNFTGSWKLNGATLYVTIEPCVMCAGAISLSRLDRVVFGAFDPKKGAAGSLYNILQDERLNHRVEITPNVLTEECSGLMSEFFQKVRKNKISSNGG